MSPRSSRLSGLTLCFRLHVPIGTEGVRTSPLVGQSLTLSPTVRVIAVPASASVCVCVHACVRACVRGRSYATIGGGTYNTVTAR